MDSKFNKKVKQGELKGYVMDTGACIGVLLGIHCIDVLKENKIIICSELRNIVFFIDILTLGKKVCYWAFELPSALYFLVIIIL